MWGGDAESESESAEAQDPLDEVDATLTNRLSQAEWTEAYDFVGELAGIGVYFLERLPRPAAVKSLQLVVWHLEQKSEQSWGGTTWLTPPELLPSEDHRWLCPAGYYNLGVAHGVPGVVGLLSDIMAAGIEAPAAQRLLDGPVRWLLSQ